MSEAEREVSSDEGVVSSYESRSSYERAYIFAAGKLGTPGDAVGCAPAARAAPRAPHGAPIHCKLRQQTCSRPTRARGAPQCAARRGGRGCEHLSQPRAIEHLVVGVVGVLAQHLVLNRDARDDEDVVLGLLGRRVRASSVTWLSAVRVVGQKGACANDDRFVSILVFILGENCDKNKGLLAPWTGGLSPAACAVPLSRTAR